MVVGLLAPPSVFGIVRFGPRAAVVLAVAVATCVAASVLPRRLAGHPWRLVNPGTLVTGLLLGLTLSADIPLYMVVVGGLVAELPGKHRPRRLGNNLLNPAALGRAAVAVLELLSPGFHTDLSTGASPLYKEAGGRLSPALVDTLLGLTPGAIGETCTVILAGVGAVLLGVVVIKRHAALAMLVTVPLVVTFAPDTPIIAGHAPWILDPVVYLASGPTLLYAVFFATDPSTTPNTPAGGVVFGVGAGARGVLGRLYTEIPGSEMWAILAMNALTPAIDRLVLRLTGARAAPPTEGVRSFYERAHTPPGPCLAGGELTELTGPAGTDRRASVRAVIAEGDRAPFIGRVERSGLVGRGGGGYPAVAKWRSALEHPGPRTLVINGLEGEPESDKDRHLMERHPDLVVGGAALAAHAIEATQLIIVVGPTFERARRQIESALAHWLPELEGLGVDGSVVVGPGLYVCGEETALIEYLQGRRGEPQSRPPYPTERGLAGRPTVVHNVETVAWLPAIAHAAEAQGGELGRLVSVSGAVARPGIYLAPPGSTLDDVVALGGGVADGRTALAFAVGGMGGGFVPPELGGLALDGPGLADAGASPGAGALRVLAEDACLVDEALSTMGFLRDASCGRCTPCRAGTAELHRLWAGVAHGEGRETRGAIDDVVAVLRLASACGLGLSAPNRLRSVLRHWPELVQAHLEGRGCATCR